MSDMVPSAEERLRVAGWLPEYMDAAYRDDLIAVVNQAYADGLAAGRAAKQAECNALQNLADKNTILIEAIEAKYTALQHRIEESPVVTCHTDDLGSHVVFVGDAPGPWHLVPVEPKEEA